MIGLLFSVGIPVDVVELYDQFGNGRAGFPGAANATGAAAGQAPRPTGDAGATPAGTGGAASAAGDNNNSKADANLDQQPQSPASNLSDNMESMTLNAGSATAPAPASGQQSAETSLLMDLDAENAGWTIVNNQQQTPPGGNNAASAQPTAPPPQQQPTSLDNSTSSFASASTGSTSPNAPPPTGYPHAIPLPPPGFPQGLPNVPLYPVLNQPQIQQILQGVSSAVSNVVRNIPIVTDPRGPMTTTTPAQPTIPTPAPAPAPVPEPTNGTNNDTGSLEMDARSMKTLNQLLAMGFSNEGGYLTRLVVAKKGDLEAVLSSLFPN